MSLEAVLFDVDGTLIDSNRHHVAAWVDALHEGGFDFSAEEIGAHIGKGGDNLVPALIPDADEDGDLAERLSERQGEIFKARSLEQVAPFPGARALLEAVRERGLKVVLASSSGTEELHHYLDRMDARALVDAVTTRDDVARTKPDPDVVAAALEKAGTQADRAVLIGDTPYDIQAAEKVGLGTIALLSGGFTAADLGGAIAIYDDVAHLLREIERSPIAG